MFDLESVPEESKTASDLEEVVMGLIIKSGQARSLAYAALKKAKEGELATVQQLMAQSLEALNVAHQVQTRLIEEDQGEGKTPVTLVLVHAQDHLMTSMLARELISELIELHEKLQSK
ncbi:PTS N,N'-diacetylchitobiose transporter subunit IIA [Vibrio mimicus]